MLEIEISAGNKKKAQLKELERYCNYEKQGNKYIIKEIYNNPLMKNDERSLGHNSKYADDIQDLLLCVLNRLNTDEVCWSCNTLLNNLSMINEEYIMGRRDMEKLSEKMEIEKEYVYDFYNNTHKSLKSKLETALNILSKKALVVYEKVLMIVKQEIQIQENEFGKPLVIDGQVQYNIREYTKETTKEERKIILKIKKQCFELLECKDEQEIISKGKWKEYSKILDEKLWKNSIKFCYYAYRITYNEDDIKEYVVGEIGESYTRNKLNSAIIECLVKGATTRHNNASKIFGIPQGSKTKVQEHKLKVKDDYISNNEKLVHKLITKKPVTYDNDIDWK